MKLSNSFFFTYKEKVKDEDSKSSNLLVRSGMVKKIGSGIYSYLPLGYKVLKNIEKIIREEMEKQGAEELLMPSLLPLEVFEISGRINNFGPSIFSLKDRYNKNYILGPTHEEIFTIVATSKVRSYKNLPFNLYQFQNKFRDEVRPRYGLIRVREFIMKDAYSFDKDLAGLDVAYNKMFNAYKYAFDRMGIDYKIVTADTGVMGGLLSEEFQAVSDIGEDILVLCNSCDYASNMEVSKCITQEIANNVELKELKKIHTPNIGKIKDLIDNYDFGYENMIKSMIYKADDNYVLVMVRSDDEINEVKLAKVLGVSKLALAMENEVRELTSAEVGFAGPVNLKLKIIADNKVKYMKNFLVGANETDYHYKNVNLERDFSVDIFADIRNIKEDDVCPKCGGKIYLKKGIEIGNTFKLGTKYSESMNLMYLDQNNKLNPVVMGSYGIGLGRCLGAIIEQNNDEKGIIFPYEIAPYKIAIVVIDKDDDKQMAIANKLYDEIKALGIEVLLDDRDERAGIKFNDMELIGIPYRITVGKKVVDNQVELKNRTNTVDRVVFVDNIIEEVNNLLKEKHHKV